MGAKKKIWKEIMHFHYLTYMATPERKNPCPGGHEIYNIGRLFLGHHYYTLILSEPWPWVEKKIFLPQNYLFWGWGGSWNLQNLVSLPYRCYIPNLVKIGPVVLEKKMLTDDGRRTTHDDGRQPIEWLRWPKNFVKLWIRYFLLKNKSQIMVHGQALSWFPSRFSLLKYRYRLFNRVFE